MTDARPTKETRPNLYGLDRETLRSQLGGLDARAFRADQAFRWMYECNVVDVSSWTNFSTELRDAVAQRFDVRRPRIASESRSVDGTVKYLLDLPDGGEVEAVSIPAEDRLTFCISSQVGCAFGCSFCMTAKLGFKRNLSVGEIVGQVAALADDNGAPRGRYNIVFMGMGEPLHNFDNVAQAIAILTDEHGFGLGPRRITVSTVGLAKRIHDLAALPVVPRLAVSLVTADQQLREQMMPIARAVDLDQLAEAVSAFGRGKRDRPTFEVVMLRGVNDHRQHAAQLASLARRADAKVNLIEFNPTPELPYEAATEDTLQYFLRVLREAGVVGTVRRSRGKDIDGACGQLAFTQRRSAS